MTSQRGDVQLTPAQVDVITRARAAVEARPADVDQDGVVEPAPDEMSDYVSEFLASPAVQPYVNEGWKVGVADLSRVCAFQPNVFVDHAAARTEDATAGDLASIAPITLPLPSAGTKLNAQYDEQRQVLMISSPNPNLRVSGFGTFQSTDGSAGFGFTVAMAASFVQVAKYQGRYLLRDGYHRSVGLLRRGIERVPCLVHEGMTLQQLIPQPAGMVPHEVFMGDRAPTLADYWKGRRQYRRFASGNTQDGCYSSVGALGHGLALIGTAATRQGDATGAREGSGGHGPRTPRRRAR